METERICSACRKPLPSGASVTLCPECLMQAGFETHPGPEAPPAGAGFPLPPVAEIAGLFPQLERLEFIGKGGMGAVYKAYQPSLDRWVAIKLLPPAAASDPGFSERFQREARALARLSHPHIVAVYDFGRAGTLSYLLMEFVEGANLRQLVRAGQLGPAQALRIIPQLCDALEFAHSEGIVHRDIKPENILLDNKGRVKIADFGIAKILGVTAEKLALTGARDIVGTPHYMAPEQVEHPLAVDHRADLYSLGVVFYELLTGELPMGKFPPPSSKAPVDARLDEVVLRALEKEPTRRYQHASQIKQDVQNIASTPPPLAAPVPPPAPSAKRFWKYAAGAVVGLIFFGGGWYVAGRIRASWKEAGNAGGRPPLSTNTGAVAPEAAASAASGVGASSAQILRYHWAVGTQFIYSVQAQADTEDYTAVFNGTVRYSVRATNGEVATLTYQGYLGPVQRRPKPGKSAGFPRFSFPEHFWADSPFGNWRHELQVDDTGRILEEQGRQTMLPQALGDLERLVFEPLPASAKKQWEVDADCVVLFKDFVPLSPISHFGHTQETRLPAREHTTYNLVAASASEVSIHKRYELNTLASAAGAPVFRLTGDGTVVFDPVQGLMRSLDFKGLVEETSSNSISRTPLQLSYHLLEGKEKEQALHPAPTAPVQAKELTSTERREALLDLKSADWGARQRAVNKLTQAKPGEPRAEVVQALEGVLQDSNWSVRQGAAKALGTWGTSENLEPLLRLLDDPEFSVRWAALEALGRIKAPQSAPALVRHLSGGSDLMQTAQALEALGSPAEEAVASVLKGSSPEVRRQACRILQRIGTTNSVPALESVAADNDAIAAMLARDALKAAENRQVTITNSPSSQVSTNQ